MNAITTSISLGMTYQRTFMFTNNTRKKGKKITTVCLLLLTNLKLQGAKSASLGVAPMPSVLKDPKFILIIIIF